MQHPLQVLVFFGQGMSWTVDILQSDFLSKGQGKWKKYWKCQGILSLEKSRNPVNTLLLFLYL